jgi:hypothetical protein
MQTPLSYLLLPAVNKVRSWIESNTISTGSRCPEADDRRTCRVAANVTVVVEVYTSYDKVGELVAVVVKDFRSISLICVKGDLADHNTARLCLVALVNTCVIALIEEDVAGHGT